MNRPAADMDQLDREYRLRTGGIYNQQSRGGLLLHKGSSPVIDNLRSTQKSSSFQTTVGKMNAAKRDMPPVDKAVFDLNSETADDINPFGSEYQNQRQNVLSQGYEPRQQQVRIIDNDGAFATPMPKR